MSPNTDEQLSFVDGLLREQRAMTAVDQFSREQDAANADRPAAQTQQRYYRQPMPATAPGKNQQFAFEVDLDACSGCKACVVACHTLNGLEEHETWRRVGTLIGEQTIQHVTTACHHCEDPGCLKGCPVKAYVKDDTTGVVRHLDDQCIGCKYCTMMCPYEVPQYSEQLGIVRKCDMCHQRLSVGEAPACVQACPNEAIRIRIVDRGVFDGPLTSAKVPDSTATAITRLAPGAPDSSITRPTTVYRTRRQSVVDASTAQDAAYDAVAESHWPLAVLLVGTQAAIGAVLIERLVALGSWLLDGDMPVAVTRASATIAVLIGGVGLNVAPLHLGQPLKAWRIFLGVRTSWLSCEAIALGLFMGVLAAATGLLWLPVMGDQVPGWLQSMIPRQAAGWLLSASVPLGLAGFYCSGMIYIATRRRLWRFQRTMLRFGGSLACLGLMAFTLAASITGGSMMLAAAALSLAAIAAKLAFEVTTHYAVAIGRGSVDAADMDMRSARLVWGPLRGWLAVRLATAGLAGLLIGACIPPAMSRGSELAAIESTQLTAVSLALALVLMIIGDVAERLLYFASVVYDRMPGTLR